MSRRNDKTVRNPVLALASASELGKLDKETRETLAKLLRDLSNDARARAEASWKSHKGPMASYWKSVAVYSRHIALALKGSE